MVCVKTGQQGILWVIKHPQAQVILLPVLEVPVIQLFVTQRYFVISLELTC